MLGYLCALPVSLALTLFNYLFCWFIALFVDSDWNLRAPFKAFQTTDALMNGKGTLPGGAGGDIDFYNEHLHLAGTFLGRWWTTVAWLCRNPTNGFDEGMFGAFPVVSRLKYIGDRDMETWASPDKRVRFRLTHQGSGSWFVQPWELYFKLRLYKDYGLRIRIGWKLSSFVEGVSAPDEVAQYVFVPHPFTKVR